MKPQLTIDRFRIWAMVAMLGVVALGSFWLLDVLRRSGDGEQVRSAERAEPDYYVEKFNFVKLSNIGQANYHITGEKLVHIPRGDNFEISQPRIDSFDENQSPVHIRADRAVIEQKSTEVFPKREHDIVHLFDNVTMEKQDGNKDRFMHLQTDYLLLLPDENIVKTDKAVHIETATADTRAIGLIADNANQKLELMSDVHMRLKKRTPGTHLKLKE